MIPDAKQHQEMAAQIAIATLDTVDFGEINPQTVAILSPQDRARRMQQTADAWAVRSWNLAAIFFLAEPNREQSPDIAEQLEEVQTKKRRRV